MVSHLCTGNCQPSLVMFSYVLHAHPFLRSAPPQQQPRTPGANSIATCSTSEKCRRKRQARVESRRYVLQMVFIVGRSLACISMGHRKSVDAPPRLAGFQLLASCQNLGRLAAHWTRQATCQSTGFWESPRSMAAERFGHDLETKHVAIVWLDCSVN